MKKVLVGIMAVLFASSAIAVETSNLSVPEQARWDADICVSVSYADLSGGSVSNTALTLTNVYTIAAGQSCELVGYVLDTAFSLTHSNAWTNSIVLTVTDAGGTNSILGSTEICADGTEVWFKPGFISSTLTYVSALTTYGTNLVSSVTTSTAYYAAMPLGNKYYSAANYVNVTLTPNDTPNALSANTAGKFRLFFRTHKTKE